MSPSTRSTANLSMGALTSVSLNHPGRNRTWSSSRSYRAKFAFTSSSGIASFGKGPEAISLVGWVTGRARAREPLERVRYPYRPIGHPPGLEDAAHEDGGPTAPYARFEQPFVSTSDEAPRPQ